MSSTVQISMRVEKVSS